MTWRPRPRNGADVTALPLDAAQGYLLSRLDGATDVDALALLLDLDPLQVELQLLTLVALGLVDPPPETSVQHPAALAADAKLPEDDPAPDPLAEDPASTATHRQRFETVLKAYSGEARASLARQAQEPDLSALCFDPLPEVIQALLENPRAGMVHARIIAAHHRTAAGLEALGGRTAFTHDPGVRRALLQNPLLPVGLFRRLWSPRRLLEQFLVASSREAPEQVRAMARDLFRARFSQRTGEEKVELILTTEGRCLASLVGLTLDGQATALLCRRTYVSTLLIQNLGRWSATPPQLIAHLRRQDAVRRNAPLRQLLERHPNAS